VVVSGTKPKPDKDGSNQDQWISEDAKAAAYLIVNYITEIQNLLLPEWSPKEIWDFLKTQYGEPGVTQQMLKFEEWTNLEYAGKDIDTFFNGYQRDVSEMKALGIAIDDELTVYGFINKVSRHFETWTIMEREAIHSLTKNS
jgi:hypothetical protein